MLIDVTDALNSSVVIGEIYYAERWEICAKLFILFFFNALFYEFVEPAVIVELPAFKRNFAQIIITFAQKTADVIKLNSVLTRATSQVVFTVVPCRRLWDIKLKNTDAALLWLDFRRYRGDGMYPDINNVGYSSRADVAVDSEFRLVKAEDGACPDWIPRGAGHR